jgi:uracil-DNA glycosylase family 4
MTSHEEWDQLNSEIIGCTLCPRLVEWRNKTAIERKRAFRDWLYWGRPVPGFGDTQASILILGLAPGAHGSNRTGRMFTGDSSGNFLYQALYKAGFANQPESTNMGDGLKLNDVYISATCRCVPPQNKPLLEEIAHCLPFLKRELKLLTNIKGIVALGRIAFDTVFKVYFNQERAQFVHSGFTELGLGNPWLLSSYHPSRQNTQTGRLTESMFGEIWYRAKTLIE